MGRKRVVLESDMGFTQKGGRPDPTIVSDGVVVVNE